MKKNLSTWTKDKKGKTKSGGEKRDVIWSLRKLDDKRLGQNKVLCSFPGVKLLMVNYYVGSLALLTLRRQISGYPPAFDFGTALTRILLCCLFLIVSFGVLCSVSFWLPLLLFGGELDYWPNHR